MINNKKIAIIGFGKEGIAAANYLSGTNEISIFDAKKENQFPQSDFEKVRKASQIKFHFNSNTSDSSSYDYIVRSPGVRPDNNIILKIKSPQTILSSLSAIFLDDCPCPIIGVTGTKGKGTTSTLIYEMIKTQNKNVYLAGNIGIPALEIMPILSEKSMVVLELSSFQLSGLKKSPHIAVVLMIVPEHLNWHESNQEYQIAKQSIVNFQSSDDFAVINADFKSSYSFADKTNAKTYFFSTTKKTNGTYLEKGSVMSKIATTDKVCAISDIFIPGKHNLQNILAAVAVAKILGVTNSNIQKTLKTFKGLPHRLQFVRNYHRVKYYNDSFSTTPETAIAAIDAFKNPKILILGGSSKNSTFTTLGAKIKSDKSIKALILIGQEAQKIKEACHGFGGIIIEDKNNMQEIVSASDKLAKSGDLVLLSPACASFDMFTGYVDRGDQFAKEVNALR